MVWYAASLPTGETQPIESFFSADRDRTAIRLKNYALIDDGFTDLIRDANGRATMRLMYNGKELDETLGPKFKTVLLWSTPLTAGGAAEAVAGVVPRGVPRQPRLSQQPGALSPSSRWSASRTR